MYLNAHSWSSFKYGVMKPEALLEEAQKAGVRTLALTDIHCTAGIPDFVRDAKKRFDIRPVAGIEFRQGARLLYIGIAKNNNGFQQLNELLSPHLLNGEAIPERAPELDDVFFIYPFNCAPQQLRPNERVGIKPGDLTRLPFSPWSKRLTDLVALLPVTFRHKRDYNVHRLLRTVAKNTVVSMLPQEELASPDECFRSEEEVRRIYRDFPQLLVNTERLLERSSITFDGSDKTREVFGASRADDREKLHSDTREGLRYRYPKASAKVLARMDHELEVIEQMGFISYFRINQDIVNYARSRGFFHVGRGSGANSLVAYCLRITDVDPMELDLYFERFINPMRKKPPDFDIDFSWKDRDEIFKYVFGKYNGTGAGTIHAAQIATYTTFQWRGAIRELGKAMGLPPEEIDALGDGQSRSYRDQRRLPDGAKGELDKVTAAVVKYGQHLIGMPHHLGIHAGGIVITEKPVTHYTALHRPPKGFPVTQFSMLEAEDLGLHKFDLLSQRGLGHIRDAVELVNAKRNVQCSILDPQCSSADSTVIDNCTLNIENCEFRNAAGQENAQGNVQCSILDPQCSSCGPAIIEKCTLKIENCEFRAAVDIHDIARFKEDPAIKELIRTGNTIGCFYVESPAMRMLLKKLRVDDYLGLVAASSIIRPGVAESGMMREYLLRHNDLERRAQAPKELMDIMPETYGVMVYQEDVLRVASQYGGLDLEDADQVRRGMNIRYRDRPEFKVVEKKFFDNCRARNYPAGQAEEVWRQIESFASFSFSKGHSASYAVESYQSLYLKAHHPLEFLVGVVNNFGGFYNTEFYLHEAKRAGAVIEAPCVNASEELCSLKGAGQWLLASGQCTEQPIASGQEPKARIVIGLHNIKSLTNGSAQLILVERRRHGPFVDLQDLLKRVPLPLEQARILVRVGALRFTGRSKPELLWDLALMHNGKVDAAPLGDLFITKVEAPKLPDLEHYPLADAYDELDLLGFPLCDPFALVERALADEPIIELADVAPSNASNGRQPTRNAQHANTSTLEAVNPSTRNSSEPTILKRDMHAYIGKRVQMLGYLIHVKATDTHSGQRMTFGSFIDPAGDFWDSTQFPDVAARYPFRGRGVYHFIGTVEEEFGHVSLRTQRFEKLPWRADPRYGEK